MSLALKAILGLSITLALSCTASARDRSQAVELLGNPADWFSVEDYPLEAARTGAEGRTVARLEVDASGKVVTCTIEQSSDSKVLDYRACVVARSRAQFKPARNAAGVAIASTYLLPVRWTLPALPKLDLTNGRKMLSEVTMEISLDPSGAEIACKTVKRSDESADPCKMFKSGTRRVAPYLNGKPAAATVTVTSLTYIDAK